MRVIKQYMGGGFGSKQIAWKHDVIAALLSQAGRPAGAADARPRGGEPGRRQPQRHPPARPPRRQARRHADRDRRAASSRRSAPTWSAARRSNVSGTYQTPLPLPERAHRADRRSTPTPARPSPSARPGYVEGAFALESGDGRAGPRARRSTRSSCACATTPRTTSTRSKPYTSPEGLRLCYERATEAFGWRELRSGQPADGAEAARHRLRRPRLGGGSGHPPGYAWVKLNSDGTADVVTGTQDIGTGTRTGLTQVAAEELGLPLEQRRPAPRRHGHRPVRAGQLRQRHPGHDRPGRPRRGRRREARSCSRPPRPSSRSRAERPARARRAGSWSRASRSRRDRRRRRSRGSIAPHMIQGQGARGPNPDGQVGPHLRRAVRRGRGRRRDRRGHRPAGRRRPRLRAHHQPDAWSTAR